MSYIFKLNTVEQISERALKCRLPDVNMFSSSKIYENEAMNFRSNFKCMYRKLITHQIEKSFLTILIHECQLLTEFLENVNTIEKIIETAIFPWLGAILPK